jgi:hypothetical protein
VQRTLWFGPAVPDRPFKTFFSTAFGFGTIVRDRRSLHIQVIEGELSLEKLVRAEGEKIRTLDWKTTVQPGSPGTITI